MKLKNVLNRIPRPLKACLCAILVMVLAVVYYIALGCPATLRQEFRRAEKAHLVGPSKIVDRLPMAEYSEFETMLVGETEHGICFFGRYGSSVTGGKHYGQRKYLFTYQEKCGDVTFAAPPHVFGAIGIYKLPVYVFTEYDNAVRATISLRISGTRTYNSDGKKVEDPFDQTFQAESARDHNGFFRFNLTAQSHENPVEDPFGFSCDSAHALYCLSNLCNDNPYAMEQRVMVIPICVTLYDADDNVIITRELILAPFKGITQA